MQDQKPATGSFIDTYVVEWAKGPKHREALAKRMWRSLTASEKRALSDAARGIAGNNLRLSAECTQSILLFRYSYGQKFGA